MPNQEITVGLRFTADVGAARQQLNSLKQNLMELGSLTTTNNIGQTINRGINEATIAAVKLKTQLEAATNVKTGNLDLTSFNKQLQQSGMTLGQYRTQLSSLGPAGQQAFIQLATSIQNAEIPIIRINKLFSGLWDTLKRTARWQISSTAIHAVMGAVQSAYGYAKDLNESLNNIRIVTGQSSEQMAKFAQNANKAAKALSTTTTAYTDAALIYYQQGLSDQEVLARADTTIKMANVTKQSAETVSDQMTAVWNNFAKGGENLESFADKMVALGAATASSSDEISQGLEKFAGVADTIGLSFDYAAAALTTITATTRMSADTVGTALKTLFSRLESLKLGESLDDGTDLTKYSEALATVGIDIKDSNGELKKMDTILDETMDKWKTLSKDQQVALAQTVAGQRQYTQFMTLMEQSDFFKKNLQVEAGAKGALQEQADIYAESWEASNKRVKAAVESIYSEIIDDKFFINLNDHLAKIISFVDKLIKSMGGLPGILSTISTLVFSIAKDQIAAKIRDISLGIQTITTKAQNVASLKKESSRQIDLMIGKNSTPELDAQAKSFTRISELQNTVAKKAKELTGTQLEEYKTLIQIQEAREKENLLIQKKRTLTEQTAKDAKDQMVMASANITKYNSTKAKISETSGRIGGFTSQRNILQKKIDEGQGTEEERGQWSQEIEEYNKKITDLTEKLTHYQQVKDSIVKTKFLNETQIDQINEYNMAIEKSVDKEQKLQEAITEYEIALENSENAKQNDNVTEEERQKLKDILIEKEQELVSAIGETDQVYLKTTSTSGLYKTAKGEEVKILDAAKTAMKDLQDITNEDIVIQQQGLKNMGIADEQIKEVTESSNNYVNAKREEIKVTDEAEKRNNSLVNGYKVISLNLNQVSKKVKDYATGMVSAARTISSITMGITSAISAAKTLKDSNLSSWEKFSSIMMSMPMIMGGFAAGINGIITGFTKFSNMIKGAAAANELFAGSESLLNVVRLTGLTIDEAKIKQLDKETQARIKKHMIQVLESDLSKKEKNTKLAEILMSEGLTTEINKETVARGADAISSEFQSLMSKKVTLEKIKETLGLKLNTIATKLNTFAHSALGTTMLSVAAAAAVVTAAVAVSIKLYNKDAEAAQKAANAAKIASDAAQEAADKYNTLKDTIEKYNSIKDRMGELVAGTQAFKDAMAEANAEALKLIQTLPGLQYTYDKNGLIQINSKDLEEAQSKAAVQANLSQSNSLIMQTQASEAQRKSTNTNFQRDVLKGTASDFWEDIGNIAFATATGIATGSLINVGIGSIIGGITGLATGIIGAITTGNSDKNEQKGLDAVAAYYKKNPDLFAKFGVGTANYDEQGFADALKNIEGVTDDVAKVMARNAEQLQEHIDTQSQLIEQERALLKEALNIRNMNNEDYSESDYKDFILVQQAKDIDSQSEQYQNKREEIKDMLSGSDKDLAEEYLKYAFGDEADNYRIRNKGGTNWTIQKKNDSGSWETQGDKNSLSQEDVIDFVTKQKLLEESDKALGNYLETAEKYGGQLERFGFSITEAQKASMTQSEIEEEEARMANIRDEILTAAAEKRAADLTSLTFKEIRELREKSTATLDEYFKGTLDEALSAAENAKKVANIRASEAWGKENGGREQKFSAALQKTLETLEMSNEAFGLYAESLMRVNKVSGMTIQQSKELALQILQTSISIRDISEILDKNKKAYQDLVDSQDAYINGTKQLSQEQAVLLGELAESLKQWLEVDFTLDELLQNMDTIQAAAERDEEAIRQLEYLASRKMVANFDIDEADKQEFYNFINYLDSVDSDLKINAQLNLENQGEFLETINHLVETGQLGAEDIEKAMNKIGVALKQTGWTRKKVGESDSTTTGPFGIKWNTHTETYANVPVYGKIATYNNPGASTTLADNSKSSSDSNKKDTTPKKVSEEIDRYHEVNAEIDDLTKKMNELSTLKDRAWGGRRIAAIRAEQQALKEYGELLQRKSDEAYEYLQQDASYLNAYGAIYDEDGRLLNSNEIIAQAVADFNAGSIDDEKFNNIKKYISNYESSLEEYQNSLYEIAENLRNEFDQQIEEITATIDVKLNIDDRQIKYIEWLVGHLEDKAFSQAAIISTASQNYDNILNKWDTYTTGIHDILVKAGASEEDITNYLNGNVDALLGLDNIDKVTDELGEYTDGLADTYDQLKDLKDLIEQQLSSVYDEWNDKIEYQIGLMEHYDSILGHYRNIVDILGLDFLGLSTKNLIDLSQAQINSSISMVQTLKARWNAAQEELKTAQANLQNVTSEVDQKFWTEEVEKLTQASNELEENFYSSWEDILNKISDLFDTTRERIFKDFEKSISDTFDSFDEMSSLLDQRKTIAAEYVPEYKKIYELNKLNRNLTKEIDKINDVNKIKKLKDLQDEINAKMREGVQLSEYDLEYMQKKYDLRLAEIALEDAQAAKTTVRLQRDSSGNYSYVYTANEEQMDDKLQDYEDKLYALQDTTENYFNTLSESYFQILQNWENALNGLDKNDKNYEQKVNKINVFYQKRMQYITSELNKGLKNNQQLYKNDQEYMNTYYTNQENRQRAFILNFKDTLVGGILDGFDSIDDATNYITGKMDNTLDQLSVAWTDYYNQAEEALQLNGMSFEDFGEKLEDIVFGENGINAKISSIAETTKEMAESSKEDYNRAASAVESFQQRVGPKLDELFQKTDAFTGALATLQQKLLENYPDPNITVTHTEITNHVERDLSYEDWSKEQNKQQPQPNLQTKDLKNLTTYGNPNAPYGTIDWQINNATNKNDSSMTVYIGDRAFVGTAFNMPSKAMADVKALDEAKKNALTALALHLGYKTIEELPESIIKRANEKHDFLTDGPNDYHWVYENDIHNKPKLFVKGGLTKVFDTGGYTGDWGADGRLAILHEKELVLNKQDTENMLSAVNVIRNLSSTLNLPDLAAKMNYLPNQISSSYFRDLSKNQEITQEVHIDASFPGVTAREEIEQAFGELALQASQYINRYDQ